MHKFLLDPNLGERNNVAQLFGTPTLWTSIGEFN